MWFRGHCYQYRGKPAEPYILLWHGGNTDIFCKEKAPEGSEKRNEEGIEEEDSKEKEACCKKEIFKEIIIGKTVFTDSILII
jgi:hypothetical protein